MIHSRNLAAAHGARALSVYLEILSKREDSAKFEKAVREHLGIGDDRSEFLRRDSLDF